MNDSEIISALCQGGRQQSSGVKALYDQYAGKLLRYFVHHNVSPEDAEDLLQQTTIKVVNAAPTYQENGTARAWIWTIARNCLRDFHRRQSALIEGNAQPVPYEDALHPSGEGWDPVAQLDSQELVDCVSGGLRRFGCDMPDNAYALTLHIEGATMAEIADHIGRSVAATKEFLSQCRKKLREYISHCLSLIRIDT